MNCAVDQPFSQVIESPDSPPPPKEEAQQVKTAEAPIEEKKHITHHENTEGVPPTVPLPVRVPVPPTLPLVPKVKRPIKQRQPFDIYEDQYEQLKSIAEAERGFVNGRGMSQMVREALDLYLARQPSSKK